MKRYLSVIFALSFSVFAVAVMLFVVRPRMESFRFPTENLRHKVEAIAGEIVEEIAELKEGER